MKQVLHLSLFLCLSFGFFSCEEEGDGDPDPSLTSDGCKEVSQTNSAGYTYEKYYNSNGDIEEERSLRGDDLIGIRTFTYNDDGNIIESQFEDLRENTPIYAANQITYNSNGEWVENKQVYIGVEYIREATYDGQGQIVAYKHLRRYDETDTVDYEVAYEWVDGNNTKLILSAPDYNYVITYQYDLEKENKRRTEQENTAFLSYIVAHNKNMRESIETTYTPLSTGAIIETNSEYNWTYNEAGYPLDLEEKFTNNLGASSVSNTTFEFSCD